ncbi:response regulator [Pedobacter alpinus]|uniref:Response regulator n=1 Tax=Pedobacter alpinus TaxID=1590643 RepID=A0ABW5TMF3_9SPHI
MRKAFLIVDDLNLDCLVAEGIVKKTGICDSYKIYNNAIQVLSDIKQGLVNYDGLTVILLDIMMPVMTGVQFVEEFETLPLNLQNKFRIIVVTTSLDKLDLAQMSRFNSVKAILNKPYSLDELNIILNKLV